jgi:ribosomal protein S18 acetylase RimI-like enzyme
MTSQRAFLLARTSTLLIAEPTIQSRLIYLEDLDDLAQLFLNAYAGSVDEVAGLDDAKAAIGYVSRGYLGEPLRDAWLGIYEGFGPPLSAILCTTWRGIPLFAHLVTDPGHRGRGYATSLIRDVARVIEADGGDALATLVTRQSASIHLYRELGFEEIVAPTGIEDFELFTAAAR